MPEDRDELLRYYGQSRQELLAAIAGLSDEQLTEATLDGWSVKDHLAHLALWDAIRVSEIERISAGHEAAWRLTDEQDDTFNALSHASRSGLALAQVRWELATSRQRLYDAIAACSDRALDGSLYGCANLRGIHEAQHTAWIARWRQERDI